MRQKVVFGIFCSLCLLLSGSGQATTLNELKVGVRILDFMMAPPRGKTPLAVIYDGENKASVADAQTIQEWVNSGVSSVRAELVPSLVDAHRLDEVPAFKIAIVASGTTQALDKRILDYALKNHALTISSDLSCLQAGKCVVGIASSPRVEVIINRSVASSYRVEFSEAFRMMVREY
ncbi:hypothetical protein [Telmatospirillum siberiense]|uniref:DUF4154 domain-containing protein n=1 Tax=Telmatospirillum siberiense TaxID=382514 RepID=A0A2N3PUT8_9PROT|nr:hypothetical protein [Telmatospirillum siberiense]PKU24172.1 hypothetical protein CWS72_12615 [Telmatospirillum siberiense]